MLDFNGRVYPVPDYRHRYGAIDGTLVAGAAKVRPQLPATCDGEDRLAIRSGSRKCSELCPENDGRAYRENHSALVKPRASIKQDIPA